MPLRPFAGHDSVQMYRLARTERLYDAFQLEDGERFFGAVYLMGYSVEMTLKIAYFELRGYRPDQPIRFPELVGARVQAKSLGVSYHDQEGYHGLLWWTDLLIKYRASAPHGYDAGFSNELLHRALDIHCNWKADMRYSHSHVSEHDFNRAYNAALWFVENSERLWR